MLPARALRLASFFARMPVNSESSSHVTSSVISTLPHSSRNHCCTSAKTGFYDLGEGKWNTLPMEANKDIHAAIEIGAKRRPADIVTLPLGRIVVQ